MTVNETLLQRIIRHLMFLTQLQNGEARWMQNEIINNYFPSLTNSWINQVYDLVNSQGPVSVLSLQQQALLRSLKDQMNSTSTLFMNGLQSRFFDRIKDIAMNELDFEFRLYRKTVPVELNWKVPTENQISSFLSNQPINGKILIEWFSGISETTADKINQQITLGLLNGESTDQIARRITGKKSQNYSGGVYGTTLNNAKAIARTGVIHANDQATREFYRLNDDIIDREKWVLTLDSRTCPICMRAEQNSPYKVGEGPNAPLHINCRCLRIGMTKSWKELGFDIDELPPSTRASMNGQVPDSMTYPEWLRTQPVHIVEQALGKTRAKLFLKGKLDIKSFTSNQYKILSLDDLRRKEADLFENLNLN